MDVHSQSQFHMPNPGEQHMQYSPNHQHHPQQWPSRLLPPGPPQSSYSSPATPSTTLQDQSAFPNYYQHPQDGLVDRHSLSLNLSSLSVASPTNLSPINPSPHASTATSGVSPITPISPSNQNIAQQNFAHHTQFNHHHQHQSQFSFAPPDHGIRYDDPQQYELNARRVALSSRSSSSSDKSIPRKRSFNGLPTLSTNVEESMYDDPNSVMDLGQHTAFDEVDMTYTAMDPNGSPIDGNSSNGEQDEQGKSLDAQPSSSQSQSSLQAGMPNTLPSKPLGTNNFVTKLYQMINDPKSAHFIAWTELGTSFVVSNVGEFSRSILGSHFKHNNFSSFVRQLNMYGFHKINRTPRAQRTSTDAQTWEFSHHKFLRGRPDLLEEIKRKALEPDPSIKHRVELPGEVAAQLNQMRDENRRVANSLAAEKVRFDRLAHVTKALYEMVSKNLPGGMPIPFPSDLVDPAGESPNIYITSPTMTVPSHPFTHHAPSMHSLSSTSLHSMSPNSSPTTAEFPTHVHAHSLSRQPSFQHPYDPHLTARFDPPLSTPLPPSPGAMGPGTPMDFDDLQGRKRQRIVSSNVSNDTKRLSRARSDSAPLGYAMGQTWGTTRPRSGSGLAPRPPSVRREDVIVPSIGSVARAANANANKVVGSQGQPLIPIAPAMKQSPE